jgi:micrococcal nuclease
MARYRRSRWREFITVAVVLLLIAFRWWSEGTTLNAPQAGTGSGGLKPGVYEVDRVVDGDTLIIGSRRLRVRLQGVDSPETVKPESPVEPWGPEASDFTNQFIRNAKGFVRVEIDGEPTDQHGRHLAFLWNGDRLLNEELVRNGLARATLHYDFSERKKERLRRAQRDAKREEVGIWSE